MKRIRPDNKIYLVDPLPGSDLFAHASGGIRIHRSLQRDDEGRNLYTVIDRDGTKHETRFKWLPRFLDWYDDRFGECAISTHRKKESPVKNMTHDEKQRAVELRRQGLTFARIAAITGRSHAILSKLCRDYEKETGEKLKRAA